MATVFLYMERGVVIILTVNLEVMTCGAWCCDNTHSKLGSNDNHSYIYTVVVIVCPVLSIIPFSPHGAFTHRHMVFTRI
jgi:hypothetical protein